MPGLEMPTGPVPPLEAYGLDPGPAGYRFADLRCAPRRDGRLTEGSYSESAVAIVSTGVFDYESEGQVGTAVPGAFLFANRAEAFEVRHMSADGNRRLVLFFSSDFLETVAEDLGLDAARFPAAASPPSPLTLVLSSLMHRIARRSADSDEAAAAVAAAALRGAAGRAGRKEVPGEDRRRIVAVIRHINAHYADSCTLDTLAAIAGMSRFRLARRFHAMTGETANRYVLNRRLSAAAAHLLASRRAVAEIACDVGFNDLSYFYARFGAAFGCAPARWRHRHAAQEVSGRISDA